MDWYIEMAKATLNHDKLFKNNPGEVVSQQLLIPMEATCAILARNMRGIINEYDQRQLQAETRRAIDYIAEHDYLAYLLFTKQFKLVREIFWEKDLFEKQLALLEKLEEEEEEEAKFQQTLLSEQARLAALRKKQNEAELLFQQKMKEDRALVNLQLYQYYKNTEQGIYTNFNYRQLEIYENVYLVRMGRIIQVVTAVKHDQNIVAEEKNELSDLRRAYMQEYYTIQQIPIKNEDGSVNLMSLGLKARAFEELDAKYQPLFMQLLEKYREHAELGEVYRAEVAAVPVYKEALAQNKQECQKELAKINVYLSKLQEAVKKDLLRSLNEAIISLDQCRIEQIPGDQQQAFRDSINRVKGYRDSLMEADNEEQMFDILGKVTKELSAISELVNQAVPHYGIFRQFEAEKRMLNIFQNELSHASAAKAVLHEQVEHPVSSISVAIPKPEPKPQVSAAAAPQKAAPAPAENIAQQFRHDLNKVREQQPNPEVEDAEVKRKEEVDAVEMVEIGEEFRESLARDLVKLPLILDRISNTEEVSVENKQLILKSKQFCKEIALTLNGQIEASKLVSLKTNLKTLSESFLDLQEYLDNIEAATDFLPDAPRLSS